ncbi:hypothetical protein EDD40_3257 [Saccharothrix texasensis]|uniref:Uncharacterized protein n=1 Tax=Saccharothrix texasensis TaxID=103734 RepID=A0A3N1H5X8_9PSEU|nr:hypothetical protein EDD40_3257 [Saccharothrix texasensis]
MAAGAARADRTSTTAERLTAAEAAEPHARMADAFKPYRKRLRSLSGQFRLDWEVRADGQTFSSRTTIDFDVGVPDTVAVESSGTNEFASGKYAAAQPFAVG